MGEGTQATAPTCHFVEVLVVDDDAFPHLLKIHVVLIRRHAVPGDPDRARGTIFILLTGKNIKPVRGCGRVMALCAQESHRVQTWGGQMVLLNCHV